MSQSWHILFSPGLGSIFAATVHRAAACLAFGEMQAAHVLQVTHSSPSICDEECWAAAGRGICHEVRGEERAYRA